MLEKGDIANFICITVFTLVSHFLLLQRSSSFFGLMFGCWCVWLVGCLMLGRLVFWWLRFFVCLFVCLSVCLSVCLLSVCLSVCVSVCLCLSFWFWFFNKPLHRIEHPRWAHLLSSAAMSIVDCRKYWVRWLLHGGCCRCCRCCRRRRGCCCCCCCCWCDDDDDYDDVDDNVCMTYWHRNAGKHFKF